MLFHCLYQHPFSDKKMEARLWNVACDLAVELLIWKNIPENLWQYSSAELQKRKQIFEFFKGRNCSAQVLYQLLKQEKLPFNIEELESKGLLMHKKKMEILHRFHSCRYAGFSFPFPGIAFFSL